MISHLESCFTSSCKQCSGISKKLSFMLLTSFEQETNRNMVDQSMKKIFSRVKKAKQKQIQIVYRALTHTSFLLHGSDDGIRRGRVGFFFVYFSRTESGVDVQNGDDRRMSFGIVGK